MTGKVGCKKLTAVSKLIGTGQSHPVDVAGGHFYTDHEDFSLPGPIPLSFERTWYSYSDYKGPLGYGWHHSYDMALAIDKGINAAVLRMADGRASGFDLPSKGKDIYNRSEKMTLSLHEDGYYFAIDNEGLIYRFTQEEIKNPFNNTESHLLQSIANHNGFAIRFSYDKNGLLTQITDSAGRILTVTNDKEGHITSIQAPDPRFQGRTNFDITRYTYNGEGDLAQHIDALDQPMCFEYEHHLMVKEVWRNGLNWNFRYNKPSGSDAKCIEVWGDGDLLHYKFDYTDPECTLVTNSLGHKKRFYHKSGLVIKYIDPNGAAWEYRYNQFNEIEWETDPLGNQQSYAYDQWGNVGTSTDPSGGFEQTSYTQAGFHSLPTEATDAAGGKWKWEYDESGNLLKQINSLGNVTSYVYEDGQLAAIYNADTVLAKLSYDQEYNLVTFQTNEDNSTEYSYDALGNCISIINPNGVKQKRLFDLKGRIIQVNDFDGNIIDLEYDGLDNIICNRDKQTEVKYTYNGMWELTSRSEAGTKVVYKYDTEEQLITIVNEQGHPLQLKRDAAGNIVQETSFDNISRRFERNPVGWITQIIRPGGKFTKYAYNEVGQVTNVEYSDANRTVYSYRKDGALMKVINESAIIQFERNVMGDIIKETVNDQWINREYDIQRNRIKTISSLGANICNQFNSWGDILQMDANGWLAKFDHDKLGHEIKRMLPGGISMQWQWDAIGRPLTQTIGHTANNNFSIHKKKQYKWEMNNRLKYIKDEKGVTQFEHDDWSNLAKITFPDGKEQLRNPDSVGNLFNTIGRTDRVYDKGGQLKKANGWQYVYNEEGHLVEKRHSRGDVWMFKWNDAGMLTSVLRPDKSIVTFTYDALGRRLSKQYKSTITKFLWDGDLPLHEWKEHSITGEKLSNTRVGEDGIVTWLFDSNRSAPSGKIKGDKQYSIITDHLGTPNQMYKEDGTLFWECELDSYGKPLMETGDVGSCPFRYMGQYEDMETGLCYNRYRYYSNEEGIYISKDPSGIDGGIMLYSYVHDTTTWVDENGLVPAYPRVKIRKSTRMEIEKRAKTKKIGGKRVFLDANTGKPIPGGKRRGFSLAHGMYDVGHKPGHEHWRAVNLAIKKKMTRDQWNDYNNDPSHYQVEDPVENQGHSHEKPK